METRSVDQLEHVLVAGDDDHFAAGRFGAAGDGADHVVGLEAGVFEHGNAHGLQQAADVGDLLQQVGRGLRAVGLVLGELLERWVGSPLSKMAAMYAGRCCLASLRSMLLKM